MTHQHQDRYWKFLTDENILRRAAHLVGVDSRHDFRESYIDRQLFSYYRDDVVRDIIQSLDSGQYQPHPITYVNIPKSDLAERPGTMIAFRDRVVVQAIIMIIAPLADEHLSDNVWSWRVKPELRGKTPDIVSERGLFGETDVSEFPFLKRKTINTYIEEFEPWYALWPDFDKKSRAALSSSGNNFMLFSDIAGYFENISLPMLRDLLYRVVPESPNTINLLMRHMSAWCRPAYDGSATLRGIPQGNAVSSFLGNLFLKPVDDYFHATFDEGEVQYFRYMDDVRIITKTREFARHAAIALERQIRLCQLNLQSAKTKLLTAREAEATISDTRLDDLGRLLPDYRSKRVTRPDALRKLATIYRESGSSIGARPISTRAPLDGLNLRTLRRWAATHYEVGSDAPASRIVSEALANPSYKVTRELLRLARRAPHNSAASLRAARFIVSGGSKFEYHEAELIRACRYFHYVPASLFDHAQRIANGSEHDPYSRFESILLLLRHPGYLSESSKLVDACMATPDTHVKIAGVLAASMSAPNSVSEHLKTFSTNGSHEVVKTVQYVRALRNEEKHRDDLLNFVFGNEAVISQRVYDYAAFLRFIATGDAESKTAIIAHCRETLKSKFLHRRFRVFLRFLIESAST